MGARSLNYGRCDSSAYRPPPPLTEKNFFLQLTHNPPQAPFNEWRSYFMLRRPPRIRALFHYATVLAYCGISWSRASRPNRSKQVRRHLGELASLAFEKRDVRGLGPVSQSVH